MQSKIASVVLEKTAYSFDKTYDYIVPETMVGDCKAGCRAIVPFGKGNSLRQCLIVSISDGEYNEKLKSIVSIADKQPILSDEMLKMCLWFHDSLFCTYFDAINAVLPTGMGLKIVDAYSPSSDFSDIDSLEELEKNLYTFLKNQADAVPLTEIIKQLGLADTKAISSLLDKGAIVKSSDAVRRMGDATLKSIRLIVEAQNLDFYSLTARQKEIANEIALSGDITVKELQYMTGASKSVLDSLVKKGVAEYFDKEIYRMPHLLSEHEKPTVKLTEEQQKAFNFLDKLTDAANCALLYGVTGSGKTQVFITLADSVISKGKGVIIMVPEISLTPQTISIFNEHYGDKIAVFHSAMSLGQRMDEWKRIKEGKAVIAIGTRSAIFAPFNNLGLVVMDEEQEHTYKSEQSPRFHTREVAKFRAKYHDCLCLLASATPSVETYANALSGRYSLCTLKNRYGKAVLPEVQVVDMRQEIRSGNKGAISGALYEEIDEALREGNQAIVLLNRRGHNTYISCMNCGSVVTCPNCSFSMTYHSANNRVMCHYCGYSEPYPEKCNECGETHLKFTGAGTQKVEQELKQLFPNANILRLDADNTVSRDSFSNYLTAFSKGEYDIMLGTQMVAKGLDFPKVTVVGVLGADKAMNSEDYRSSERTFSLLTQVIGRAGRGDKAGKAIIQTNNPDSDIIPLAQSQDYEAFYSDEILLRKAHTYPPYCDLVTIRVQSQSNTTAYSTAGEILAKLRELTSGEFADIKLIVLGPTAAAIPKVNNKYRYRLTVKCKNSKRLRELLRRATEMKLDGDTSVIIDINPENIG